MQLMVRQPFPSRRIRRAHPKTARLAVEALDDRALPSTFTVSTVANDGPGSLRQAILDSNANAGADTIAFNIGSGGAWTIQPTSTLPEVTDPVVIDGATQPGYAGSPLIVISGSQVGPPVPRDGLTISADNSIVRGLVINGFSGAGLVLQNNNGGIRVVGNYFGTDATGTVAVPNGHGMVGGRGNTIGGTAAGERNLISGNKFSGISVGSNSVVQGNFIGTDVTGTRALGNLEGGLGVSESLSLIGGTTPAARNVIAGNGTIGLSVSGTANRVQGNFIGTDVTGTVALPNFRGIHSFGSSHLFGGTEPGAGNLISGNRLSGLDVFGGFSRVEGNRIGTDVTGTRPLPNAIGVFVDSGQNTIGGTAPGAGNLISGNTDYGLVITGIRGFDAIQGNFIGTDVTGTRPLGNGVGVHLRGGENVIGGPTAAFRNLISGNRGDGIAVEGSDARFNRLEGNFIGTDVGGTHPLGNGGDGISLSPGVFLSGASDNVIGGGQPERRNTIAFNLGAGVSVRAASTVRNSIRGNSIHSNAGLGIDLSGDGVTANDPADADTGPNQLQNTPVVAGVMFGATTNVTGTLNSTANTTFTLDFYAGRAFDQTGFAEGPRHLGSATVTTDAGGNASFDVTLSAATTADEVVTATATDPAGNTSEFSAVPVSGAVAIDIQPTDPTNVVNLGTGNVVSVAVLTTPDFDAGAVDATDLSRIRFGDTNGTARVSPTRDTLGDIDGDGDLDRVFVFSAGEVRRSGALTAFSTQAELTGFTFAGLPFRGVDAVTVDVPPVQDATIDIQPGNPNNFVDLHANGLLQVAVLTTSGFDAAEVDASDLSRIRFGDVNVTARVSPVDESLGDVDGDGDLDRVLVFSVRDLRRSGALTAGFGQAELTGVLFGGDSFRGTDAVAVIHPLAILPPTVEVDPGRPGTTVLVVEGTPGNDRILVRPLAGSATNLEVVVNGFVYGPFAPTGGVRGFGYAGNDRIEVASSVAREAVLDGAGGNDTLLGGRGNDLLAGGPGNDALYGRPGNDVLTGGDGNDILTAGLGRDVLIGGAGADRLVAGSAGSVLVAGPTLFDLDPTALAAIRDEWSSARGYVARAANIRGENNPLFAGRLNGNYFLRAASPSPTAFDDGARDTLVGGLGMDWFLANRIGGVPDVLSGSTPSEFKDELG